MLNASKIKNEDNINTKIVTVVNEDRAVKEPSRVKIKSRFVEFAFKRAESSRV